MILKELYQQFNIPLDNVPQGILDIDLSPDEPENYNNYKIDNQKTIFHGSHSVDSLEYELEIIVDLKPFNLRLIKQLEPYILTDKPISNEIYELDKNIDLKIIDLIFKDIAVTVKRFNKNFTNIHNYSIFGGLIQHS